MAKKSSILCLLFRTILLRNHCSLTSHLRCWSFCFSLGSSYALLVFAETVVSKFDDEKGNWDWKGRSEVLEVIALLASANRSVQEAQLSDTAPISSRAEDAAGEVEISPTIPWMAEEGQTTDALTIVERGRRFSVWSEKRRRLREG